MNTRVVSSAAQIVLLTDHLLLNLRCLTCPPSRHRSNITLRSPCYVSALLYCFPAPILLTVSLLVQWTASQAGRPAPRRCNPYTARLLPDVPRPDPRGRGRATAQIH